MSNIELIMNPYIAPVYITSENTIIPLMNVSTIAIKNFLMRAEDTIKRSVYFMTEQLSSLDLNGLRLFIAGIVLLTFVVMFADNIAIIKNRTESNKRIQELEQEVRQMKKAERMRENDWDLLMHSYSESFKQLQEDYNKKFTAYDKQLKKMDKELKMYQ